MILNKKIIVVLPAYNAERTLENTFREIPSNIVDEIILCDDKSTDATLEVAKSIGIKHVILHEKNMGYGANQKSCYKLALDLNADIVIMLHPDFQYTPKLIPSMVYLIAYDLYDVVLGSRILNGKPIKQGMPPYKYIANRALTLIQNFFFCIKLSEYHSGYRAYSRKVLLKIDFRFNDNDFVFDNQFLSQVIFKKFRIAEIPCPTSYHENASSIGFSKSVVYGLGVLKNCIKHLLHKLGVMDNHIYRELLPAESQP
ncbi:MAG: glycosyltransferase family 2 protein [Bacteroidetes bacterium]|nr:glycosyltransferase family 2 protein [Bacteroidota bacterium]